MAFEMLTDWFVAPEMRPELGLQRHAAKDWPYEQEAFNRAILDPKLPYAERIVLAPIELMTGPNGSFARHLWGAIDHHSLVDYKRCVRFAHRPYRLATRDGSSDGDGAVVYRQLVLPVASCR